MSKEALASTGADGSQSSDGVTNPNGIGLFRLVTTVITLIVGAGVFTLAGDQAAGGASGAAIITAWSISAVGVFCLVMTFFALSRVKPDLASTPTRAPASATSSASTPPGATGSARFCARSASRRCCSGPCPTSSRSSAPVPIWPPSSAPRLSSGSTPSS